MKTGHFEGSTASSAAKAANNCDERTQRELAAFDLSLVGQRLVAADGLPASWASTARQWAGICGWLSQNRPYGASFWVMCPRLVRSSTVFSITLRPLRLRVEVIGSKTTPLLPERRTKIRRANPSPSNVRPPGPRAKARSSAPGLFYLAASFGQKGAHLAKDFILSVDEAVVVRIRKHHDSTVRNRFTKELDLLFFELASFL